MSAKSTKRLRDDTTMADMSVEGCLRARKSQKIFSLEHPGRSLALHLPSWQELMRQDGVFRVDYTACMFEGGGRRKAQVLIVNRDEFKALGIGLPWGSSL